MQVTTPHGHSNINETRKIACTFFFSPPVMIILTCVCVHCLVIFQQREMLQSEKQEQFRWEKNKNASKCQQKYEDCK